MNIYEAARKNKQKQIAESHESYAAHAQSAHDASNEAHSEGHADISKGLSTIWPANAHKMAAEKHAAAANSAPNDRAEKYHTMMADHHSKMSEFFPTKGI